MWPKHALNWKSWIKHDMKGKWAWASSSVTQSACFLMNFRPMQDELTELWMRLSATVYPFLLWALDVDSVNENASAECPPRGRSPQPAVRSLFQPSLPCSPLEKMPSPQCSRPRHPPSNRRPLVSFQEKKKKQVQKWKWEIKLHCGLNALLTKLTERWTYQRLDGKHGPWFSAMTGSQASEPSAQCDFANGVV